MQTKIRVTACHHYRCDREVYQRFKSKVPRSQRMGNVCTQVLSAMMYDDMFRDMVVANFVEDLSGNYSWVDLRHLTKKVRKEINKGLKELVEVAKNYFNGAEVTLTGLVTSAFRLIADGKYALTFDE